MTGLARDRLELDDAVDDLGDLELEQPLHQAGVRARHDDLRALGRLAHLDDVGLEPAAVVVALVLHLLGLREQRLDLAEVEQRVALVGLLDDPGDDVALAARVLLVLHLALGLADALEDHLLGRLRGDAAEVGRACRPTRVTLPSSSSSCAITLIVAGLHVDLDQRLLGGVGHALVRRDQRVRERLQHDLDRDALLALDVLERLHHL